jgi:hypothetical protein
LFLQNYSGDGMTRDPLVRERIEQIARMVLEDQIGILEAIRALLPLLHGDPEMVPPDDYNLFRGIDSETDDLPLGKVRGEWNSDALLEKDREIARCELLWREQVRSACERILRQSSRP